MSLRQITPADGSAGVTIGWDLGQRVVGADGRGGALGNRTGYAAAHRWPADMLRAGTNMPLPDR